MAGEGGVCYEKLGGNPWGRSPLGCTAGDQKHLCSLDGMDVSRSCPLEGLRSLRRCLREQEGAAVERWMIIFALSTQGRAASSPEAAVSSDRTWPGDCRS